nr:NAD(P)H-dependent oxidoreductase [uncultured Campylobacter sp.]
MKILLINGGAPFNGNGGKLSKTLHELTKRTLESLGHETRETTIHEGYDLGGEVEKFLWMDAVIWQMPTWWMGEPWVVKKYIDEVFMFGIVANDGYGTSGLIKGKSHMLSITWNASLQAFDKPGDFFEGVGVDGVYLLFHKANEFLSTKRLPTFMCNDVIKNPDVERFTRDYEAHLKKGFWLENKRLLSDLFDAIFG